MSRRKFKVSAGQQDFLASSPPGNPPGGSDTTAVAGGEVAKPESIVADTASPPSLPPTPAELSRDQDPAEAGGDAPLTPTRIVTAQPEVKPSESEDNQAASSTERGRAFRAKRISAGWGRLQFWVSPAVRAKLAEKFPGMKVSEAAEQVVRKWGERQ